MFTDYGFSEEQVRLLHKLMDDDGDGSLTFQEWWQWLNTKGKLTLVEDDNKFFFLKAAADMFNEADKDGDGSVTRAECGEMLAMQWEMEPHDVEETLKELDADGNGIISLREFVGWLSKYPDWEELCVW